MDALSTRSVPVGPTDQWGPSVADAETLPAILSSRFGVCSQAYPYMAIILIEDEKRSRFHTGLEVEYHSIHSIVASFIDRQ
jgi:hypothetical protein